MNTADDVFLFELDKRGLKYTKTQDDLYEVLVSGEKLTICLDNIRRNYLRDGDEEAVSCFLDNCLRGHELRSGAWEEISACVRYSLEPSDYELGFDGHVTESINEKLTQVYVTVSPDEGVVVWVNDSDLESWGVTREQVIEQAEENMAAIVADTVVEVREANGFRIGMLSTKESTFKASLVLSQKFRDLVAPSLGWPVYVVVPCRDFVYVVPNDCKGLLGSLGATVLREFNESGYPITTDILQISDQGITAIGTYAVRE
ncbi:hypothetical protein [Aeoliella mucimassa]|uniref:DUF1444 domain-containing protein n=1 Tax=Aeoliella mucimassa TaxID=2527972 RepID=A0A518AH76_9BACT|nr:hypothetical protein [Aeoliella mucimassa]QDU54078.1 hypothetical protein Pan181_02580 [Aeoliella mucimassa]